MIKLIMHVEHNFKQKYTCVFLKKIGIQKNKQINKQKNTQNIEQ